MEEWVGGAEWGRGVADGIWSDTKTQHPLSTHSSTSQQSIRLALEAEISISTFSSSRQTEDTIWSWRVISL